MSQRPPEDSDLVSFLRQHRSNPPPAAPDLEERILQSLPPRSRHRHLWIVPSAIAASLVGAIVSYQFLRPTPPDPTEMASIEAFMESNWNALHSNADGQTEAANYLAFDEASE